MTEGFAMALCGTQGGWQIVPEALDSIDIEQVGLKIEADGFEVGVRSRLCWTFTGSCDLTLYPSGKLLVKTADEALAKKIADFTTTIWTR